MRPFLLLLLVLAVAAVAWFAWGRREPDPGGLGGGAEEAPREPAASPAPRPGPPAAAVGPSAGPARQPYQETETGDGADGADGLPGARIVDLPEEPLAESIEYRDSGRLLRVWVNPRLLAEFPSDPSADPPGDPPVPGAWLWRAERGVRFWRLEGPETSVEAAARLRAEGRGLFSAVVHDAPSTRGQVRALRGGLRLKFPPSWSATEVEAWGEDHALTGLKPLTLGPGWYAVACAPGVGGLGLARDLMATGDLLEAVPNWWRDVRPR